MNVLGIIGGTGIDQLQGLQLADSHQLDTPYGEPSRAVQEGRLGDQRIFFLQRHGSPRAIPPHLINYRANLWALQSLGVTDVVAINAVGGISASMRPGRLVIPDQLIDYTWGREHTFDTGADGSLMHIDFTHPYDPALRDALLEVARQEQLPHHGRGVHGVMQGPRLETAAEIRRMERDGCDLVGMTGMPEAVLAREMELCYASVSLVVNRAAGRGEGEITMAEIEQNLNSGITDVRKLLEHVIPLI